MVGRRGQLTIEYVLILVIVLTIISLVSIPLINYTEDTVLDVGYGVLLGGELNRISNAIHAISVSGCGSSARVSVNLNQLADTSPIIDINSTHITASYYLQNGTRVAVKAVEYPPYTSISLQGGSSGDYLVIQKDCSHERPSNSITISV